MALVASAGPASNIFLATLFMGIWALSIHYVDFQNLNAFPGLQDSAFKLFYIAIKLNLMLAFFNLLPLPPLDGFRIVQGFIKEKDAQKLDSYQEMGQWILLILMIVGALRFLAIPIEMFEVFLFQLFGIGN
jgi:Zn-dependent protease